MESLFPYREKGELTAPQWNGIYVKVVSVLLFRLRYGGKIGFISISQIVSGASRQSQFPSNELFDVTSTSTCHYSKSVCKTRGLE